MMKPYVFSCDWGTSSLRLKLVDAVSYETIEEVHTIDGIAVVYERYKRLINSDGEYRRMMFYTEVLRKLIQTLAQRVNFSLEGIPIIISGMASSNIGMKELPYAVLPFSIEGGDTMVYHSKASAEFTHDIILLSGVKGDDEVMRGEETQLVGISEIISSLSATENILIILPGTHSKHVHINNGNLTKIETYITGELFAILSQNGLIKEAVKRSDRAFDDEDWEIFLKGVKYSGETTLLQSLFKIRTNQLFNRLTKQQNYIYLSGLLIGSELRELSKREYTQLVLCSDSKFYQYYKRGIEYLGLEDISCFIDPKRAEEASVIGQLLISKEYLKNE